MPWAMAVSLQRILWLGHTGLLFLRSIGFTQIRMIWPSLNRTRMIWRQSRKFLKINMIKRSSKMSMKYLANILLGSYET